MAFELNTFTGDITFRQGDSGDFTVIMSLDDELGSLMTLELTAPDQRQAIRLGRLFEGKAEMVYNLVMTELLDEEEDLED